MAQVKVALSWPKNLFMPLDINCYCLKIISPRVVRKVDIFYPTLLLQNEVFESKNEYRTTFSNHNKSHLQKFSHFKILSKITKVIVDVFFVSVVST